MLHLRELIQRKTKQNVQLLEEHDTVVPKGSVKANHVSILRPLYLHSQDAHSTIGIE
jgi:hypothetical protein